VDELTANQVLRSVVWQMKQTETYPKTYFNSLEEAISIQCSFNPGV